MMASMTAATEELSQTEKHHCVPLNPLHAQPASFSHALFLPEILFEIGAYLQEHELWSSSLVCVTWNRVFAPFLHWKALSHGYFLNPTLLISNASHNYNSNKRKETLFLENFLERIDGPDAAFDFHRGRNVYLSSRALECNEEYSNATEGKARRTTRLDWLCIMVVEKSILLEALTLNPDHPSNEHCYRWSSQLQIESGVVSRTALGADHPSSRGVKNNLDRGLDSIGPLSMIYLRPSTPRWPRLAQVSLEACRVDHTFLRILLSNAPALEDLSVTRVVVLDAKPVEIHFDGCSLQEITDKRNKREDNGMIQEASYPKALVSLSILSIVETEGLGLEDVIRFANQLPHLAMLVFQPIVKRAKQGMDLHRRQLPAISGTLHLGFLSLTSLPSDMIAFTLQSAPVLYELVLMEMPLDRFFLQNLVPAHSQTLRTLRISGNTLAMEGNHILHLMLCTLHDLRRFIVSDLPMVCDPRILQQTPWVCQNLQELRVVPKCSGSSQYSTEEAQKAFMTQVGALKRLIALHLVDRRVESVANGFTPETSLGLLRNLAEVEVVSLGFSAGSRLGVGDAEMVMQSWPLLEVLFVDASEGTATFTDHMKEHAPRVQLKGHTR